MAKIARIGDRLNGFCYYAWRWHHTTYYCGWWTEGQWATIVEGSPKTNANGLRIARLGDKCQHDYNPSAPYPHPDFGNINSCSSSVNADSKGVARMGDTCSTGGGGLFIGTIVTGSNNVNSG